MHARSLAGLVMAAAVSVALPAQLLAQADKPKPQPPAEKPADPTKKEEKPSQPATKDGFPAVVKKKLYAKNDLRGKAAPKFEVEKWLSASPPEKDADRKNKVILIDFWATWCPPCRALIPELEGFKKKFKDDLLVIGVSDEPEQKVKDFMKQQSVTYAMAIDTRKKMKDAVGVEGIPHVLLIDSQGIVRWQGFPQSEEEWLTEEVIKKVIDADKAARAKDSTKQPESKPEPGKGTDQPPAKK